MEIPLESEGDVTILCPAGRLDAHTSPEFERFVLETISGGSSKLLIDGAQLEYLSSAGLRALLAATKKIRSQNGNIGLCSLKPQLIEIIEIAGFNSLIPVYPDRQSALAALA